MSVQPRKRIEALPPYVPGAAATIKVASNENSLEPLPSVVQAISNAARTVNRYPDSGANALVAKLAETLHVRPDQLATGCGSVSVFQQILQAFCDQDDEVVYAWRSFEAYPLIVEIVGATSVQVPLKDFRHDLSAMLAAITDRTRVVVVCNPNNPTGTAVTRDELSAFLDAVPDHVLVIIDEAYTEYVTNSDVPDGIELMRGRTNVAVLRTFSKAYGLAGLRVGYLVADDPVVAQSVAKSMMPFSVSSVAQVAALASLAAAAELKSRVADTVEERERFVGAVRELRFTVPESEGNFIWLATGESTPQLVAHLFAQQISVRGFASDGIRITIGTPEQDDAVLAALRGFAEAIGR
ncbi:MAG: histidinol-phosphate transaminase [Antricoccus sp.]